MNLDAVAAAAQALADACHDDTPISDRVAGSLLLKALPEQRYTLGVAYPAFKADRGRALDGRRDFASPEVLERTAWTWMAKSRRVGLFHGDLLGRNADEGHATPVESYIYRGPDWQIGDQLVKAGDWLLGLVWDEETWPLVKSGRINGLSPQGRAKFVPATAERVALLRY